MISQDFNTSFKINIQIDRYISCVCFKLFRGVIFFTWFEAWPMLIILGYLGSSDAWVQYLINNNPSVNHKSIQHVILFIKYILMRRKYFNIIQNALNEYWQPYVCCLHMHIYISLLCNLGFLEQYRIFYFIFINTTCE